MLLIEMWKSGSSIFPFVSLFIVTISDQNLGNNLLIEIINSEKSLLLSMQTNSSDTSSTCHGSGSL